jgi:hypothetical protein
MKGCFLDGTGVSFCGESGSGFAFYILPLGVVYQLCSHE